MDDNILLKIALFSSLIGIIVLFLILHFSEIELVNINEIDDKIDEKVRIQGRIVKVSNIGETTFIEISQECTITGIIFDNISLKENTFAEITGTVDEYNGEKEIIIDEIRQNR
ncbi:hypothetical protein JW949_02065 [Candidatus Woesearchaeota archaeon]|nr:hypothetical protein [Candidatus Woesearchaeota archaeon]